MYVFIYDTQLGFRDLFYLLFIYFSGNNAKLLTRIYSAYTQRKFF